MFFFFFLILIPISESMALQLVKSLSVNTGDIRDMGLILRWKITWRQKWQPSPVFLSRESHGWRSLAGYSPHGRKESDLTERLDTHVGAELSPGIWM